MNWTAPEMWADQTVYIIGGGASVLKTPLHPIHDRCVLGVNNAFTLGPWVDVTFFGDQAWWERECLALLRHPGLIVTCLPGKIFADMKRVKQLTRNNSLLGIHTKTQDQIRWNQNSGAASINLAILLGAAKVVLLGFDFKTDRKHGLREGHNWHDFHNQKAAPAQDIYETKFLKGFKCIARDLEKLNNGGWHRKVEILNATPGSALDVFPRVSLGEAL